MAAGDAQIIAQAVTQLGKLMGADTINAIKSDLEAVEADVAGKADLVGGNEFSGDQSGKFLDRGGAAYNSALFASLDAMVAEIGAARATILLAPGDTKTLTGNLTIPANVTLDPRMGVIETNGFTLTIEGECPAVNYQVFDISGGGGVTGLRRANPRMFGAVGDGATGTDDLAAFRAADAAASEEVVVHRPSGAYYNLSGPVDCSVSWRGVGMPQLRMTTAGASEDQCILRLHGYTGERCEISGFDLRGTYDGVGTAGEHAHGIRVANSRNVFIHDNVITAPYGDCVYFGSISAANLDVCENVHVYRNRLINPRRCAIAIVSARNVWIHDNEIEDAYEYVATIDIEPNNNGVELVENVWIERNTVNGRAYFVKLYCPSNAPQPIRNVTIRGNRGSPLFLLVATGFGSLIPSENVTVEDNEIWSVVGDERMLNVSNIVRGLRVLNNRDLTLGATGVYLANAIDPIIEGNLVFPDTTFAAGMVNSRTRGWVIDSCTRPKVRGNVVRDVAGTAGSNGAFRFLGAQDGAELVGNDVIGGIAGYVFDGQMTDCLFDSTGECSGALITLNAAGSDVRMTDRVRNRGAGTVISGSPNLLYAYSPETLREGVRSVWGTAAPTSGTWVEGSVVRNVTIDGFKNISHWICIVGGTPGVWRAVGTGRGSTAERPTLAAGDTGYTYWDTDLSKLIHWNGTGWDT